MMMTTTARACHRARARGGVADAVCEFVRARSCARAGGRRGGGAVGARRAAVSDATDGDAHRYRHHSP